MNTLITSASAVHQVDIKDIDVRPGPYCMSFGFDLGGKDYINRKASQL